MDFINWCSTVLERLVAGSRRTPLYRHIGVDQHALPVVVCGADIAHRPEFQGSQHQQSVFDAAAALTDIGALDRDPSNQSWKVSQAGKDLLMNPLSLCERICGVRLEPDQEQLVRVVNRLSPKVTDTYAWLEPVEQQAILGELGWNDEGLLWAVASQLHELGFADNRQSTVGDLRLSATYRGLIWETRRRFTLESRLIDDLVAEWETTSVDFKRELHTDTADQKAELIKDVIGLANTQASGRRGIIIGFDDKTRDYFGPPIPKLTQNHFEQLVAQYASPVVDLRWEVVDSRAGKAGKLEVIRDRTKLPHRVAKSIGDKRRVSKDQVFVRHGSQTETPTPYELSAIEEEGERARGKPPE